MSYVYPSKCKFRLSHPSSQLYSVINWYSKSCDFNTPSLHWDTFTDYDDFTFQLCDILFDMNLFQYIDKPTHVHGNTLDVVLANSNLVCDIKVHDTLPNYYYQIIFQYHFQSVVHLPPVLLFLRSYIFWILLVLTGNK